MESVQLAQKLIRFPSLNPPGDEADCIAYLADMLAAAGLSIEIHEFAPRRPSIVARAAGTGAEPPLCFTGHVDVVPLGERNWTAPPFAGEIIDGKLFGRGSSDMKGGVAAFVTATLRQVARDRSVPVTCSRHSYRAYIVITGGPVTSTSSQPSLAYNTIR